ncbi:MAG TPA: hypothetical protein VNP89_12770 [Gaiellaceae bacterium]|nr:hypothetical protein [Gaiellaceae bacterium]
MRHLRLAGFAITVALIGTVTAGAEARAPQSAEPTVACDRIVLRARSGAEDGFRILLGAVAVPGARHLAHNSSATRNRQWRYYRNAGIAIRAGTSAVSVSVPDGWRDRVAVSWGDSPASSSLRFAPCGGAPARAWNSYSGGFHLRTRGDCVPLLVTVGGMSTTVRFGVGRACGDRG